MIVPVDVSNVIKLPNENGKPRSAYIAGHAVPNSESGNPNPMNAMYMMSSSSIEM